MWYATPMQGIDAFSRVTCKSGRAPKDGASALVIAAMYMHEVVRERGPGDAAQMAGSMGRDFFALRGHQLRIGAELIFKEDRFLELVELDEYPEPKEPEWLPEITFVHVGTAEMLSELEAERSIVWERLTGGGHNGGLSIDDDHGPLFAESVSLFMQGPHSWLPIKDGISARPEMPLAWDAPRGWTVDKICPPRKERFGWSIAETI